MGNVIEIEGLAKKYRPDLFRQPRVALRGLDLVVRRGEIYGLVGPNGAGKTSTFKILLGLQRPGAGRGSILGYPLGDRRARARLGFLPELPAYYRHLRVREVLRLARALSGLAPDREADHRLLGAMGLEGQIEQPIRTLSKGQVQRVGLAQALVHGPELLILDEPMSGLDPLGRGLVKDVLRAERARGTTILLSSHVLGDVEALADSIGLLEAGRMLAAGRAEQLLEGSRAIVRLEGTGILPEEIRRILPPGSECFAGGGGAGGADGVIGIRDMAGSAIRLAAGAGTWTVRVVETDPVETQSIVAAIAASPACLTRLERERENLEEYFLRRLREREAA